MSVEGRRVRPSTRAKQARVRTAARQLFLEHGFGGTSMDAVAAAAGVSKQTVYSYYPSKAALFTAVLRASTIDSPLHPLRLAQEEAAPRDAAALRRALTSLAQRIVGTMLQPDYLALLRVVIAEAPRFPELADLLRRAVPERGADAVGDLL